MPLEHGDAFCLRRVSGDHRPDAQVAHERAHLVGQQRRALHAVLGGAHTTRSRGGWPEKKALRFSSARNPIAARVSRVALPRCGSRTTFSIVRSSGVICGSRSYTSSAAPAIVPARNAATRAASSTTSPRAVLIRKAVGFIRANRSALMR